MNNRIYVNDNNVIYNYEVLFDIEEFDRVIDDIDTWYGKGELKTFIGLVCPEFHGKKTDVFAEVELDDGRKQFFFYQYVQHPLARTANAIMRNNDRLESSKLINILSNWHTENDDEKEFLIRLMSCFQFNRMNLGDAFILDLTEEDKRSFFERACDAFKEKERDKFIVVGNSEFVNDLDRGCICRSHDVDITYTEEDKKLMKRRVVTGLPISKDINK